MVAEKIMLVRRDKPAGLSKPSQLFVPRGTEGRCSRKNARLKYTIDRMGLDTFKTEVEKLLGFSLSTCPPVLSFVG